MRNRQQKSTQYVMARENAQAGWRALFNTTAPIARVVRINTHATVAAGGLLEGVRP